MTTASRFSLVRVLPRAAVDTNFLIKAFESDDEVGRICRALLDDMMTANGTILVPSIVLAEFEIKSIRPLPFPRSARFQIASFDEDAALEFKKIGHKALQEIRDKGVSRAIIRNDAMIAATAKRHLAAALLSHDVKADMIAVCGAVGLTLLRPVDLVVQGGLF